MDADIVIMDSFIDKSNQLAECVQSDIRSGGAITNETVVALAHYISALEKISKLVDNIKASSVELN